MDDEYGLWLIEGGGWLQTGTGEIFHTTSANIAYAQQLAWNGFATRVRVIGHDGLPAGLRNGQNNVKAPPCVCDRTRQPENTQYDLGARLTLDGYGLVKDS